MPKNLTRYKQAGHLHFVTFSYYRRQPLLADPTRRDLFDQSLETIRLRYNFFITEDVVMPDHIPTRPTNAHTATVSSPGTI